MKREGNTGCLASCRAAVRLKDLPPDAIRILLIGSAPYMPQWWRRHGRAYLHTGWLVAAINNAWKIPGRLPDLWLRADDYFVTAPPEMHPAPEQIAAMQVITPREYDQPGPVRVAKTGGGTMLLNALQFLLNRFLAEPNSPPCALAIAGCDLHYPPERGHFYPGGTADPLRCGDGWIRVELERLAALCDRWPHISIYNVGGSPATVLPFAEDCTRAES